jgi:ABC-type sugar transport system ATPase subunit
VATEPAVLLLDEPLANLDPVSRSELRDSIRSLQRQLRVTTIYVTHDQNEAAAISDEIVIMNRGAIQQVGTASNLYQNPDNLFVAEFFDLDRPNVFLAAIRNGRLCLEGSGWEFPIEIAVEGKVTCVLRQRAIRPVGLIQGRIQEVQHTGWSTRVTLNFSGLTLRGELPFSPQLNTGEDYSFGIQANDFLLFDSDTGNRLRN